MKSVDRVAVKEGGTITIPCFYDNQYKLNSKYWCKGYFWHSCTIIAHVNDTGKWTLTDYPAHNIFTVKLNNPMSSDSGSYWCAVEIGSHTEPDDRKYLYVTVKKGKYIVCGALTLLFCLFPLYCFNIEYLTL